jgi:hypothetical protein
MDQTRKAENMTPAELAEWDAEIEAEYRRVVLATKRASARKQAERYVRCPMEFLVDVCRLTRGRAALMTALCVYRRSMFRSGATPSPGVELAQLGVGPTEKLRALHSLASVGIIQLHPAGPGQATKVTLSWRPRTA